MINRGVLLFDANGRIRCRNGVSADRIVAGVPIIGNGLLAMQTGIDAVTFPNGNPIGSANTMACIAQDPQKFGQGGLPIAAFNLSRVCVDITGAGVIAKYNAGLPYTAAGRLVLAVPE